MKNFLVQKGLDTLIIESTNAAIQAQFRSIIRFGHSPQKRSIPLDILMVILRLIHIFSAVIWAGLAFTMVLFITPVVQTMGAEGGKFMQRISSGKIFRRFVPSVAGLTVLSGLIMYYRLFGFLAPLDT